MPEQTPEKDEYSRTRQQMTAHIDVCMGGRVAEELIFGAEQVTPPFHAALPHVMVKLIPPHTSLSLALPLALDLPTARRWYLQAEEEVL